MKKLIIALMALMLFSADSFAQSNVGSTDYKMSLGVKVYPGSVTFKYFIKEKAALEGLLYFHSHGSRITGLYEFHYDIKNAPGLKWYVGPGAHIGFYSSKYGGGGAFGVDGVIGLDYKIQNAPLNFSLDWQPSFEFGNRYGNGFSGDWGGISIRYVF
ncbi:MAG: hypothetical protein KF829_05605 [Ferruginibacter sp.]|nr:hypothetical protein [Ferruginibacter sp.]